MSSKPSRSITTQMEIRRFKDQYPPTIFFARMFTSLWFQLMREIEQRYSHTFLEKVLRSEYLNQTTVILISTIFPHSVSKEGNHAAIKKPSVSHQPVRSAAHLKKLAEPRKSPIIKPKSAAKNPKLKPFVSELHPNQLFSIEAYFKLFQELAPASLEFTVFAATLEENWALVKSYQRKPPPSIIAIITYLEQCSECHIVIRPRFCCDPLIFTGAHTMKMWPSLSNIAIKSLPSKSNPLIPCQRPGSSKN